MRDQRVELARLRDELQGVRAEEQDAKLKLARIEGERQAEIERTSRERRTAEFKQNLLRFGALKQTERGTVVTLPNRFGLARAVRIWQLKLHQLLNP
ncbi:MAG: hypothetical protein WKF84_29780 [Pyrinomonadaceae bacterium]